MTVGEGFLLVVRWLHLLAAVVWVGGSIFYLIVLRPAARAEGAEGEAVQRRARQEFRAAVDTAILVLVLTGAVLAFDRLTTPRIGAVYVGVLAAKVALSLWMFFLAHSRLRGSRPPMAEAASSVGPAPWWACAGRALAWTNLVAVLGVVVFVLSDLLRALFEQTLRQGG
ncbi:MAG: hypothetical protein EXR47_02935 [Dehalococcoidia bacterium]|nr:hypothetical protein [Dehalococcoidia bacterium]